MSCPKVVVEPSLGAFNVSVECPGGGGMGTVVGLGEIVDRIQSLLWNCGCSGKGLDLIAPDWVRQQLTELGLMTAAPAQRTVLDRSKSPSARRQELRDFINSLVTHHGTLEERARHAAMSLPLVETFSGFEPEAGWARDALHALGQGDCSRATLEGYSRCLAALYDLLMRLPVPAAANSEE